MLLTVLYILEWKLLLSKRPHLIPFPFIFASLFLSCFSQVYYLGVKRQELS